MTKTQIQLPEALHREAKRVAHEREISLAELCRRGLEYMLAHYPSDPVPRGEWKLPTPRALGGRNPFTDENWREQANLSTAAAELVVRETSPSPRRGKRH